MLWSKLNLSSLPNRPPNSPLWPSSFRRDHGASRKPRLFSVRRKFVINHFNLLYFNRDFSKTCLLFHYLAALELSMTEVLTFICRIEEGIFLLSHSLPSPWIRLVWTFQNKFTFELKLSMESFSPKGYLIGKWEAKENEDYNGYFSITSALPVTKNKVFVT